MHFRYAVFVPEIKSREAPSSLLFKSKKEKERKKNALGNRMAIADSESSLASTPRGQQKPKSINTFCWHFFFLFQSCFPLFLYFCIVSLVIAVVAARILRIDKRTITNGYPINRIVIVANAFNSFNSTPFRYAYARDDFSFVSNKTAVAARSRNDIETPEMITSSV